MKNRKYPIIVVSCLLTLLCVCGFASCGKKAAHEHTWDDGVTNDLTACKHETVYTCTGCGETRTESFETHAWSESTRLSAIPTGQADGKSERYCTRCGKAGEPTAVTNVEYTQQWIAERSRAAGFALTDFGGGNITTDLNAAAKNDDGSFTPYAAPTKSPVAGHPRVLFDQSAVAGIKTALTEERNGAAAVRFYEGIASMPDGQLGEAVKHEVGTYKYIPNCTYNYDEEQLRDIQALALDYQLTGNKVTGYRAIYAIKNYILTLKIVDIKSDPERQYGSVMYTAACVYDWCYDLMTATDKTQIVSGIEHKILSGYIENGEKVKMEIGFPPYKQYSVAGHGCEYQLLRDYLAFAIAIYDEYPTWWEFIAGRIYQEYIAPRNYYYEGGMVTQGVSLYARVRYAPDLYSAWLLKTATGENPYDEEGMKQVMRSIYCYELPNGNGFAMGDSHETKIDGDFINYGLPAMMASYLFGDETIRAQLESREGCYTKFSDPDQDCFEYGSVTEYLICSSTGVKAADDVHKDIDLIFYNGGWLGQIIARNSWDKNQAAVLMKIGVRTGGNHDHADAGQFQIYYKGMLAGDTGVYDSYNSDHEKSYHRQTIAHNCVLINGEGQTRRGGDEMSHRNYLTDGNTLTGKVTGVAYGYADPDKKTPTYAYIAGDVTPAFYAKGTTSSSLVSEVQRRMLVVYDTGNADAPMYFFVFDGVTAKSACKKTFLLHTRTEPTIEGNVVTEKTREGGKLVLQSVFGGTEIQKIGGYNNNYNVNGEQIAALPDATSRDDGFWGRVEISTGAGNKTDRMLNVMYVCDSSKNPNLPATGFSNDTVTGAVIGKTAAVFVGEIERRSTQFGFTAPGSGDLTFYVSGVKAGTWTVTAGGATKTVNATEDGGLLVFTAPAGTEVTLTPQ